MEIIVSGYCRVLDGPRTVMADTEDREADCAWPDCIHAPQCPLAAELWEQMGGKSEK